MSCGVSVDGGECVVAVASIGLVVVEGSVVGSRATSFLEGSLISELLDLESRC